MSGGWRSFVAARGLRTNSVRIELHHRSRQRVAISFGSPVRPIRRCQCRTNVFFPCSPSRRCSRRAPIRQPYRRVSRSTRRRSRRAKDAACSSGTLRWARASARESQATACTSFRRRARGQRSSRGSEIVRSHSPTFRVPVATHPPSRRLARTCDSAANRFSGTRPCCHAPRSSPVCRCRRRTWRSTGLASPTRCSRRRRT